MTRWGSLLLCLLLLSCAPHRHELDQSYTNHVAKNSRLAAPSLGPTVAARTYRNRAYAGAGFAGVVLAPVVLAHNDSADRDYLRFLSGLRKVLAEGTVQALLTSGRFDNVYPAAAEAAAATAAGGSVLECQVEAYPHVTPSGNELLKDPVFGDERQKLIAVFTLREKGGGDIVLKYTSWVVSKWEYGNWAMDDLQTQALHLIAQFADVVRKY